MILDRFSVDGQTAIVTGASSGIGREIAEQFAAGGANVVICSREQENVDPVAEAINEQASDGGDGNSADDNSADGHSGRAVAIECDATDRDAVETLVEATVEEFGDIDCLVNNAGASFMANFDDISPNGWSTIVDINLTGTYHCTQAAGEHLKDGGGTVINLASVAGQMGSPYMSHYGAAKAAVINLTSTISFEWANENVRVNCIAPGFVATSGVESQMGVSGDDIDRAEVERRIGAVEGIADVAQFLASDASSYLVGETITAKGMPDILETPDN